jgi:hypothetical protein
LHAKVMFLITALLETTYQKRNVHMDAILTVEDVNYVRVL